MKKYGRTLLAMTMAVAMATATIGSMVPTNGIIAEAASIKLSKTSLKMKVGQSKLLKVKGTKKKAKWSVSNGKIVKVTKKGKVTAKKAGSANVIAKVSGKKLICKVKVTASENAKATTTPSGSPIATVAPSSTMTGNTSGSSSSGSSSSNSKTTSTPRATTGASITPTATSEADKTESTKKPSKTDVPKETKAPSASDDPEGTTLPKKTKAPSDSEDPEETEKPEETTAPKKTKAPSDSEDPEETEKPEETIAPKKTKAPSASEDPEETKIPDATKKPTATATPAEGDVTEIKVGDTESVTLDGIEFTYTARERKMFVEVKNTTNTAKTVKVHVALSEEGQTLTEDDFYYGIYIEYLDAGQTYYDYVYNFSDELYGYSVKKAKISAIESDRVGCLKDIEIEPETGKNVEELTVTAKYNGDVSKVNGKNIYIYGAIVYYDSKDNIVDIERVNEIMKVSESNNIVLETWGTYEEDAVRYKVVLAGAEYYDSGDGNDEDYDYEED